MGNETKQGQAAPPSKALFIEILADACLSALAVTGKWRAEEQAAAINLAAKSLEPQEVIQLAVRLGNISADRQMFEKSGIIPPAAYAMPALAAQIVAKAKERNIELPIRK